MSKVYIWAVSWIENDELITKIVYSDANYKAIKECEEKYNIKSGIIAKNIGEKW